jgi:hypothetical protein
MGFSIRKAESVVCSKAFFSFFSIRWLKYMRWCVSGCHSASHFRSQEGIMGPLQAAEGGQLEMWRIEVLLGKDYRCVVICKTKTRNFAKTGFGQAPDDFTKKGVCSMLSVSSWPIAR